MNRLLSGVLTIAALARPLLAQARRVDVPGNHSGTFVHAPPVRADLARSGCLTLGDDSYDASVKRLGPCTVKRFVSISDTAADRHWSFGLYATRWLLPLDSLGALDTVRASEVVLFTAPAHGDGALTPVWHSRFDDEDLLPESTTIDMVSIAMGGALVAVRSCVNGTGGCTQDFFFYRAGRWRVARTAFLDALQKKYPGGIRHGFGLDVHTMKAEAAVYSDGDPNCCPSHVAEMQLGVHGDALEIVSLRLRAP